MEEIKKFEFKYLHRYWLQPACCCHVKIFSITAGWIRVQIWRVSALDYPNVISPFNCASRRVQFEMRSSWRKTQLHTTADYEETYEQIHSIEHLKVPQFIFHSFTKEVEWCWNISKWQNHALKVGGRLQIACLSTSRKVVVEREPKADENPILHSTRTNRKSCADVSRSVTKAFFSSFAIVDQITCYDQLVNVTIPSTQSRPSTQSQKWFVKLRNHYHVRKSPVGLFQERWAHGLKKDIDILEEKV